MFQGYVGKFLESILLFIKQLGFIEKVGQGLTDESSKKRSPI